MIMEFAGLRLCIFSLRCLMVGSIGLYILLATGWTGCV